MKIKKNIYRDFGEIERNRILLMTKLKSVNWEVELRINF